MDEGSEPPEFGACFCGWGWGGASVDANSETSALDGLSNNVNVDVSSRDKFDQVTNHRTNTINGANNSVQTCDGFRTCNPTLYFCCIAVPQLPSIKRVIDPYELGEEDEKDIASCINVTAGTEMMQCRLAPIY